MKELIYGRLLLAGVERHANRLGFHDGDYAATWAQHGDRVLRLARALREGLGVGQQEHFAVLSVNSHRYVELYHGGLLGGGVIIPLNQRLNPRELAFVLDDAECRVVFVDAACADLAQRTIALRQQPTSIVALGEADVAAVADYETLLGSAEPVLLPEPAEEDPALLMYTGGTTGLPKGALSAQRAEVLNLYHAAGIFGREDELVYLQQTPMFHVSGLTSILGLPAWGGVVVTVPAFSPPTAMEATARHGVNFTALVPTMIAFILNHPEFSPERVTSWRKLLYGASPMPSALLARLQRELPELQLYQGYGMTEAGQWVACLPPEDHRGKRLRSAGRPLRGVRVCVQDPDGRILGPDQPGEICAQGGNFMSGYWNRAEETEQALRDGWFHTGDAGYVDGDGYLYLVDRVKDMIVTGAENVYSAEVENVIASHPAVGQVAVIGIPHETWVEQVHAIVVLKEGQQATAADITSHVRERLASYKMPKSVEFRTEPLPLSGAMKVLKRELRRPYWEGHDLPAAAGGAR